MSGIHQMLMAAGGGGTKTKLDANTTLFAVSSSFGGACAITNTKTVVVYTNTPGATVYAVVVSVNAGVISVGTPVAVASNAGAPCVCKVSASTVMVEYVPSPSSFPTVVMLSISGTSITVGSAVALSGTDTQSGQGKLLAFSGTAVLCSYIQSTGYVRFTCVSVSGMTITANVVSSLAASTSSPEICVLSSTIALLTYYDSATYRVTILTLSGTTLTPSTGQDIIYGSRKMSRLSSDTAISTYANGSGYLAAQSFYVSGGVVYAGTQYVIDTTAGSTAVKMAQLDSIRTLLTSGPSSAPKSRVLTYVAGVVTAYSTDTLAAITSMIDVVALSPFEGLLVNYDNPNFKAARISIF